MMQDFSIHYDGSPHRDELHRYAAHVMSEHRTSHGIPNPLRGSPRDYHFGLFGDSMVFRTDIFPKPVLNGIPTRIPEMGQREEFIARLSCDYKCRNTRKQKYVTKPNQVLRWLHEHFGKFGVELHDVYVQSCGASLYGLPVSLIRGKAICQDERVVDMLRRGIGGNRAYGSGMILFSQL